MPTVYCWACNSALTINDIEPELFIELGWEEISPDEWQCPHCSWEELRYGRASLTLGRNIPAASRDNGGA